MITIAPLYRPISGALVVVAVAATAGCRIDIGAKDYFLRWPVQAPRITMAAQRRIIELRRPDGATLRGIFLQRPDSRRAILYLTGNRESVLDWVGELEVLSDRYQADVLCMDYRGAGLSDQSFPAGRSVFSVLRSDVLAVHDDLRARVGRRDIVLVGFSLGSAMAMHVAAQRPVAGVVLRAALGSVLDVPAGVRSSLPWFMRPFFVISVDPDVARLRPQPIDEAPRIRAPVLMIHGTRDSNAPIASGRRIFGALGSRNKTFCPIERSSHGQIDVIRYDRVRSCMDAFFASIGALPGRAGEAGPATANGSTAR